MNLIDQFGGENDEFDQDINETSYLHCSQCGATSVVHKPLNPDVSTLYAHLPLDYWDTPFNNGVKKIPPIKTKRKQLRKRNKI